ncbi:hypothetical protein HCN44_009162 [Aphidius gifuensis]|uniref:M-phase phosphoprotein 6 n=1 Tax=Aphidius gifuensis TaxID=684658 RepID=A0A834Y5T1_APHGI|nr:M-phase phosphoprotein 6 [Aphidius gifuensis]KAF7997764.1 hypothetical protein HCN44_009162 [Aphidius gifuensis]
MTKREDHKFQLSKSILDMKFMKRTKEKVDQETFQAEGEEYFDNLLTSKMKQESGKFIIENSFVYCEGLSEGRLSFQGMNPEIERIIELEENAKRCKEDTSKEETEITDEQMAKHYKASHVNTMAKKFAPKRNHHKYFKYDNDDNPEPVDKKPKFLKPKD